MLKKLLRNKNKSLCGNCTRLVADKVAVRSHGKGKCKIRKNPYIKHENKIQHKV